MGIIAPNLTADLAALRVDFAAEVLRNVLKDGWSVLNLSAGIADAFTDASGISALGGAVYDGVGRTIGNPGAGYVQLAPTGATFGNMAGLAAAFDGTAVKNIAASASSAGNNGYAGKAFSAPASISKVVLYSPTDGGFENAGGSTTLTVYGKASSPVSATDGAVLGSVTFADAVALVETITFAATSYQYVWCVVSNGASSASRFAQVVYFGPASPANVATVSTSFVPAAAVSSVRLVSLWQPVDASTLGVDCLMDATANGGTNWAGIALSDLGKFDASTRIVGGLVNVAPGSLVAWRWRTANSKSQLLRGVFAQWK